VIDADPLPDRPGADVDADEWSLHHRLLYRLVLGAAGSTTADLQLLYDAVAPVAYRGTTASPLTSRRWRRKVLNDLRDAGVVEATRTTRGWVWTPTDDALEEEAGARGAPDAEVSPGDA
jgi:hypothetical protein